LSAAVASMADDVIVIKAGVIERCIRRAREELAASEDFATDYTRQDAAILNVERACEAAIDIADRVIRLRGLEPSVSSRDSFAKLEAAGIVNADLADRLSRMVGSSQHRRAPLSRARPRDRSACH
jgi:uncharacterized protein YutE (UPF0331/DUF86 family)